MSRGRKKSKSTAEQLQELNAKMAEIEALKKQLEEQRKTDAINAVNTVLRRYGVDTTAFRESVASPIYQEALIDLIATIQEWDDDKKLKELEKLETRKTPEAATPKVDTPATKGENAEPSPHSSLY